MAEPELSPTTKRGCSNLRALTGSNPAGVSTKCAIFTAFFTVRSTDWPTIGPRAMEKARSAPVMRASCRGLRFAAPRSAPHRCATKSATKNWSNKLLPGRGYALLCGFIAGLTGLPPWAPLTLAADAAEPALSGTGSEGGDLLGARERHGGWRFRTEPGSRFR